MPPPLSSACAALLAGPLAPFCPPQAGPGPGPFRAINREGVRELAGSLGLSPVTAMILCLDHGVWPLRFARNRGVWREAAQQRLLASRVAVLGCGGLGGHVVTLLARTGIGAFTLCDGDVFDESNYNRQILCEETTLGRNKAEVAKEALARIAPHADVRVFPLMAEPAALPEMLRGADIVMDCLDSFQTRRDAASAAGAANIPFIHGAVAGDEGFAMVMPPGSGRVHPLLEDSPASGAHGAESRLGVSTLAAAAAAVLQAALAVRVLTGNVPDGGEKLYHLDLAGPLLEIFSV